MKPKLSFFLLILCFISSNIYAIEIADIVKRPEITHVKISPNGKYLALRTYNSEQNKHYIFVINRADNKHISTLGFPGINEVGDYFWANDERIVIKIMQIRFGNKTPKYYGELYAVNYDGKKGDIIFGYRGGEKQVGSFIKKKSQDRAWADIVDRLPDDEKHILISSTPWSNSHKLTPQLQKIDIYKGLDKGRIKKAAHPNADFFIDKNGDARVIRSIKEDYTIHVETLPDTKGKWIELQDHKFGNNFYPLAINKDGSSLYVLDNLKSDKSGLHLLSLDGSTYKNLYTNSKVDISDVERTSDENGVFAMRVDEDYPKYLIFSKAYEEAEIFKRMLATFPGRTVSILNSTADNKLWVIKASSDVEPGSFYIYDQVKNKLKFLFSTNKNIKPDDLSKMEPISFNSFDEKNISGYFTQAKNKNTNAPLVVFVHGGPRSRDYWGFNPVVQSLSISGFSVLQINYRGSEGYGMEFMNAGNKQWGNEIQKDILAGVQWAIKEKRATQGNICIMGGSFGAYSAVQSAILFPDQYQCVVANAGVYDLELMFKDGNIEDKYWGDAYLEEALGTDKAEWKKFSPVHNVDSIKAPIFLAHGKKDPRAPYKHFQRLKKALKKSGKDFVEFVKKDEDHGFYLEENQREYIEEVVKFLKQHTKQ
ncbi:MAG: alpha/beta hydrolase family protein [Cellvibrionaceae bacterium]